MMRLHGLGWPENFGNLSIFRLYVCMHHKYRGCSASRINAPNFTTLHILLSLDINWYCLGLGVFRSAGGASIPCFSQFAWWLYILSSLGRKLIKRLTPLYLVPYTHLYHMHIHLATYTLISHTYNFLYLKLLIKSAYVGSILYLNTH